MNNSFLYDKRVLNNPRPFIEGAPSIETKKHTRLMRIGAGVLGVIVAMGVGGFITYEVLKSNSRSFESSDIPMPNQQTQIDTDATNALAQQEQVADNAIGNDNLAITEKIKDILDNPTEEYNSIMEKYRDMSIDDFEELPLDDRLIYSQFTIDQTVARGTYDNLDSRNRHAFKIEPKAPSIENSGQDILDNFDYTLQIAYAQFVEADQTPQLYDVNDGTKVLSSAFYKVGKNKEVLNYYLYTKNRLKELSGPVYLEIAGTSINASDLKTQKTSDGKTKQFKIVKFNDQNNDTLYSRFIYNEFTSYDGSHRSTWLLEAMSDSLEKLNNQ